MKEKFQQILKNFSEYKNYTSIEINNEEDIQKIPLTTREDLRKFQYEKCPEKPLWILNTSGSSGLPALIYLSAEAHQSQLKRCKKMLEKIGITKEEVTINLIDNPLISFTTIDGKTPYMDTGPYNQITADLIEHKVKTIKPSIMFAIPTMAYDLLEKTKINSFRRIFLIGSMVTDEFRKNLEEMSGAKVQMLYGCSEVGLMAIEENKEYELIQDQEVYYEVVNKDGTTNKEGRGLLAITDFTNKSMPIIRYIVGDEVMMRKEGDKKLIRILGRTGDFVKINTNIISKTKIIEKIMDILGHDNFQIKITNDKETLKDKIEVKIPPEDKEKEKEIIEMIEKI